MPIPIGVLAQAGAGGGAGPAAFDLLQTTILSTTATSVTFSNLGNYTDYKHLQIRGTGRTDDGNILYLRMNGDTSQAYSRHQLTANGSSVSSSNSAPSNHIIGCFALANNGNTTNIFSGFVLDILDFSNVNKFKTIRSLGGNVQAVNFNTALGLFSGVWRNTNAITSLTISNSGGNYVSGTRFSLYGIK